MIVRPTGVQPAKYLVVGETPSRSETLAGAPFSGQSGKELMKMLAEAGISQEECRFTNVVNLSGHPANELIKPSKKQGLASGAEYVRGKWAMPVLLEGVDALRREIIETQPSKVIGLGNLPLWACTGQWGITKWRGSQLVGNIDDTIFSFLPSYHPSLVNRKWEWRWIAVEDFKRASRQWSDPDYDFLLRPSYGDVITWLDEYLVRLGRGTLRLAVDIETRQRQIACIGLGDTDRRAICIPILCVENPAGYWTVEEELNVIQKLSQVLTHQNAHIIGQNYIYDMQYFARLYGIRSRINDDTMLKHHCAMPGTQKGLDFLSSIYCRYHRYWKDESKEWDPRIGEEQLWEYNCKDCCATFEANTNLDAVISTFNLTTQYQFQMQTQATAFNMMLRGVKVDPVLKARNSLELAEEMINLRDFIQDMLGGFRLFGPKGVSAPQMSKLAYSIFGLPKKFRVVNKKRVLTANKEAVEEWCHSVEPIFRPILQAIRDYRSLGVYKSTFADSPIDTDGRFRCSINAAGTITFRWSTSADAFGFGTNMQNIPKKRD